jgi:hypothetical protein
MDAEFRENWNRTSLFVSELKYVKSTSCSHSIRSHMKKFCQLWHSFAYGTVHWQRVWTCSTSRKAPLESTGLREYILASITCGDPVEESDLTSISVDDWSRLCPSDTKYEWVSRAIMPTRRRAHLKRNWNAGLTSKENRRLHGSNIPSWFTLAHGKRVKSSEAVDCNGQGMIGCARLIWS